MAAKKKPAAERELGNFRDLADWQIFSRFVQQNVDQLPDILGFVFGWYVKTLRKSEGEAVRFDLVVSPTLPDLDEDIGEQAFHNHIQDLLRSEFPGCSVEYWTQFAPQSEPDRKNLKYKGKTTSDVRSVHWFPIRRSAGVERGGKKKTADLLGACVFFSSREPEDLFRDTATMAVLNMIGWAAVYSLGYYELHDLTEQERGRRQQILDTANQFRSLDSRGRLFRSAAEKLSVMLRGATVHVMVCSRNRVEIYRECSVADTGDFPDRIPLVKGKNWDPDTKKVTRRYLPQLFGCAAEHRRHLVPKMVSPGVPEGIFPFRTGREVEGFLVVGALPAGQRLDHAETEIARLLSQTLEHALMRLDNRDQAERVRDDRDFTMRMSNEIIRTFAGKSDVAASLGQLKTMAQILTVSAAHGPVLNNHEFLISAAEVSIFLRDKTGVYNEWDVPEEQRRSLTDGQWDDILNASIAKDRSDDDPEKAVGNSGDTSGDQDVSSIRFTPDQRDRYRKLRRKYPILGSFGDFPPLFIHHWRFINGSEGLLAIHGDRDDAFFAWLVQLSVTLIENGRLLVEEQEKKLIEQQLRLARSIQQSFLPQQLPPGISAISEPSREIGGDYYGVLRYPGTGQGVPIGLVLADVSGKGPGAALITVMLKTLIRVKANEENASVDPDLLDLTSLVGFVNRELKAELVDGYNFATMICLVIDPDGICRVVNCAHPPILLRRARTGKLEEITSANPPVGIIDFDVEMATVQLEPGDTMLLYTDGITEGTNGAGEMYEDQRLVQTFMNATGSDHEACLDEVFSDFKNFVGDEPLRDDATMVVIQWKGTPHD